MPRRVPALVAPLSLKSRFAAIFGRPCVLLRLQNSNSRANSLFPMSRKFSANGGAQRKSVVFLARVIFFVHEKSFELTKDFSVRLGNNPNGFPCRTVYAGFRRPRCADKTKDPYTARYKDPNRKDGCICLIPRRAFPLNLAVPAFCGTDAVVRPFVRATVTL